MSGGERAYWKCPLGACESTVGQCGADVVDDGTLDERMICTKGDDCQAPLIGDAAQVGEVAGQSPDRTVSVPPSVIGAVPGLDGIYPTGTGDPAPFNSTPPPPAAGGQICN